MAIGCCHAFKKCSDAGVCIQINDPNYEEFYMECYYSENLAKGLNFYTEYNENNKARAEEYKRKQENKVADISEEPVNEVLQIESEPADDIEEDISIYDKFSNKYMNAYIVIDSRQFFIGTRGGYHNLTYSLGGDGVDKLSLDLKNVEIYFDTEYMESKYFDEYGTDDDRADWRVVVTISDTDYHILNSDTRALRKESATMVAEYFSSFGYKATCECLGNSKLNFTIKTKENSKVKVQPDKPKTEVVISDNSPETTQQMSLFELLS